MYRKNEGCLSFDTETDQLWSLPQVGYVKQNLKFSEKESNHKVDGQLK